MHVKRNT